MRDVERALERPAHQGDEGAALRLLGGHAAAAWAKRLNVPAVKALAAKASASPGQRALDFELDDGRGDGDAEGDPPKVSAKLKALVGGIKPDAPGVGVVLVPALRVDEGGPDGRGWGVDDQRVEAAHGAALRLKVFWKASWSHQ